MKCHLQATQLYLTLHVALTMNHTYSSEHSARQSNSVPPIQAPVEEVLEKRGFEIMLEDSNVLRQHLEEWKIADSAHRSRLYEKLMGELYQF